MIFKVERSAVTCHVFSISCHANKSTSNFFGKILNSISNLVESRFEVVFVFRGSGLGKISVVIYQ